MSQTRIQIDRLSIQSKGLSPSVAHEAVAGLGQELITALSQQPNLSKSGNKIQISQLSLEKIKVSNPQDARSLQHSIAEAVTQAILTKLDTRGRR
jgi:hypothetical protein